LTSAGAMVTSEYLNSLKREPNIEPAAITEFKEIKNARVLLVEDNQVNQMVAMGLLEDSKYQVDCANDGLDALKILSATDSENLYDVILMDCQMPEMDGFEATRQIRLGNGGMDYQKIPIIAMTANAMIGDKERCLDAGMDDYISKPVDGAQLIEKLAQWAVLKAETSIETESQSNIGIKEMTQSINVWDQQDALMRMMGKKKMLARILQLYVDGSEQRLFELQEATSRLDVESLREQAHTIKGVAANVSATQLNGLADSLEQRLNTGDFNAAVTIVREMSQAETHLIAAFQQFLSEPVES